MRGAVHRFAAGGFDAVADAPRPGRPAVVTREDREALADLLDESARQGRTCTAAALRDWLAAERGVRIGRWLGVTGAAWDRSGRGDPQGAEGRAWTGESGRWVPPR
ncbi:helix-turn-helix domain-containing protein [Streptomyces sp. NPDC059411]|uniref:helix-turn-helix domain-containing protein n=1 Tax=Streptomyces sp. NPDC059411 TaxID=3346825 RepID=UPI00367D1DE9